MDKAYGSLTESIAPDASQSARAFIVAPPSFARQVAPWLISGVAIGLFLYLFSGVIMPFALGLTIGYLLNPLANKLEKMGMNRLGAALFILAVFLIVVVTAFIVIVPILGHQLSGFAQALPQTVLRLQELATTLSGKFTASWGGDVMAKLGLSSNSATLDLQKYVGEIASEAASWAAKFAKSLISGGATLISLFSLLVVTPVVAFYLLVDWNKMVATVNSLVPPRFRGDVRTLADGIDRALAGFLRGQSLVCLFLGLWYGGGLTLVGLNFGFLIGLVAGFLSFIPYVGSLTALLVSAAVAIVQGWPEWKLFAMAMTVVATGQFLEGNVLSPKLVGGSVGLHPVWLMFALLAFGSLFGFTGLIVAVPVAAALGVLLRFAIGRYKESPFFRGVDAPTALIIGETTQPLYPPSDSVSVAAATPVAAPGADLRP